MNDLLKKFNLTEKILFCIGVISAIPLPIFVFCFLFGVVSYTGNIIYIIEFILTYVPISIAILLHNKRNKDNKININYSTKDNWLPILSVIIFIYAVCQLFFVV